MPALIKTQSRICEVCKAEFHRRPRRPLPSWERARWCSPECAIKARKNPPLKCERCGEPIAIKPRRRQKRRFCGVECANLAQVRKTVKRYRQRREGARKTNEHVLIAEKKIGRRLRPHEVVHHRDLDKMNNDPANLRVMSRIAHGILHAWLRGHYRHG